MIYDIHNCRASERGALIEFVRNHWNEKHIFTYCDAIFDFQHASGDGSFNFIIALNTISGEIDGVIGHIPLSIYDPALKPYNEAWGALWKVRNDVQNEEIGMLGLLLNERMIDPYTSFGNLGLSGVAKKFYKIKKFNCGALSHYYIANSSVVDFKIASFGGDAPSGIYTKSNASLREVNIEQLDGLKHNYHPVKTATFIANRYIKHPIYDYNLIGVFEEQNLCCVLISRTIDTQNSRCIRIVDIYGDIDSIPNIYAACQQYLQEQNAEYIDCLNYGIDQAVFTSAGFVKLDLEGDIVIPNYFEPFVRANVTIDFAYTAPSGCKYTIFKGDSDQDRPNLL